MKYYEVITKCGHVGKRYYIPIKYAVVAEDGKEAALKARNIPRVKHNHKDAILSVRCITFEDFLEINENNKNDPYLKCHSRQEQNLILGLSERLEIDEQNVKKTYAKQSREERVAYKLKKQRIIEESLESEDYKYAY